MISKQAKVIKKILKASNKKSEHNIKHTLEKRKKYEKSLAAIKLLSRKSKIEWADIEGTRVAWVSPLVEDAERTIIYIHGGGFVYGLSAVHVAYVDRLAEVCRAKVLLIDYSLSPEARFPVALNEIYKIWKHLISDGLDPSKAVLMGDSAGASLSISVALKLRSNQLPQPSCLVLFSPSVDSTLGQESYIYNNDKDIILDKEIMNYFVESYVGQTDRTDVLISPIRADLHSLPSLLLQVGSDEVLLDECKIFVENAKRDGVDATLKIGKGMWHNWHLSAERMPESSESLKTVADFIAGNC